MTHNIFLISGQHGIKNIGYDFLRNEDFSKKSGNEKTKVVFISLDSKKDSEKLKIFVAKHLPEEHVIQFTDNKYNDWIDKIDSTWSGSIPATLFVSENRRTFHEKQFESFEELQNTWLTFLKQ